MPIWSRREFVAGSLATAGLAFTASAADKASLPEPSLKDLARAKGLKFGTALAASHLTDARYCDIVRHECGLLVAENEMKWYVVHKDSPAFDFAPADALVKFAADNQLEFRGHTLLWHYPRWMPEWVNTYDYGPNPKAEVERLVVDYINKLCGRYPQIQSWDVVNETIDDKTGELRETVFSKHYGQGILDLAFHTARAAAPKAQLVYNDYMNWEPASAAHRTAALKLLEGFRKRNVPVDALGIQAHIAVRGSTASEALQAAQQKEWKQFLDEVVAMGYGLLITELDVNDKALPADTGVRDRGVAEYVRAYLDLMLSYPQLKSVLTWGFADQYSWLQDIIKRPDGLTERCLPYASDYSPKPFRDAIAAAFKTAPAR
jgi:endo-1,4-beta-xylanase